MCFRTMWCVPKASTLRNHGSGKMGRIAMETSLGGTHSLLNHDGRKSSIPLLTIWDAKRLYKVPILGPPEHQHLVRHDSIWDVKGSTCGGWFSHLSKDVAVYTYTWVYIINVYESMVWFFELCIIRIKSGWRTRCWHCSFDYRNSSIVTFNPGTCKMSIEHHATHLNPFFLKAIGAMMCF